MKTTLNNPRLPFGVALVLLTISAGFVHATPGQPDCYVLSVGVDSYHFINKLRGCVGDAHNTVAAFSSQRGKLFGQVYTETLLDGQATHANVLQRMNAIGQRGSAGDFVVVFLSGHGGRPAGNRSWYFLPVDYSGSRHASTALTDRQILDTVDRFASQGKKVFVIVDACHAGQLSTSAQSYLARHRNPQGGGIVLMLSSHGDQLSNALGSYSAFAKAFADGMTQGDLNRDGRITLQEVRTYSYNRTYQLLKQKNINDRQDSEFAWSPSMSGETPVALLRGSAGTIPPVVTLPNPVPQPPVNARILEGTETLGGYGALRFELLPTGRAVMHDTKGANEGTWNQQGGTITLRFFGGRVIYTGVSQNGFIQGNARNERTSWNWSARDSMAAAPVAPPVAANRRLEGSESLGGYGALRFDLLANGRAVMHDTQGVNEGTWNQQGGTITLRFFGGRVIYTGVSQNGVIQGNARNERTSWNWSARDLVTQ